MNDVEQKFAELCLYFEAHTIFHENKGYRGKTFSGKYFTAHWEASQKLNSLLKESSSLLLTSSDTEIREKVERFLKRPNLLADHPDKNLHRLTGLSVRDDIETLYHRTYRFPLGKDRGLRFLCLAEATYPLIKQQLKKRHWEIDRYFKNVKSFAKYVKTREQLLEQSLSEQDIEASITDIHINYSGTGIR